MKRFVLLLFVAAAAALAIWLGMRGGSPRISSNTVTALLPQETIAFVLVPDLRETRARWHESDLYKLWREPALQDFLQQPLAANPSSGEVPQRLQELDTLGMRDAFLALIGWDNGQPQAIAGFRFNGSADDAEKVVGQWRGRAQLQSATARRETVAYAQHKIEVTTEGAISVATVYDGDWFLAANDVGALKTLLDRVDRRAKEMANLSTEETFAAAFKHMPRSYAALAYVRVDRYFEKLVARLPPERASSSQLAALRKVRSIAAATGFQDGKVRDVMFVGMPKAQDHGALTRSSLALATAESFLYSASFIDFPQPPPAEDASAIPPMLKSFFNTFSGNGVTPEDWKNAFGTELGIIGDWTANARFPALLATLPVRDAAAARHLLAAVTSTAGEGNTWAHSDKAGIEYYVQAPVSPMLPVAPAIGVSDRIVIAGLDVASVEAAMQRAASTNSTLTDSSAFKAAERLVGAPQNAFIYVDTALLYSRLDAALRPMLVMAAAFMPSIAGTVDLGKLPPAEVITRHLSPLVLSQAYDTDGYVAESQGPVSLYGAAIALTVAMGAGASFYQQQISAAGTP